MSNATPRDMIEPDARTAAQCIADEQFVHGLLEHLHRDGRAAQNARVESVMRAIRSDDQAQPLGPVIRTAWRSALAAAASIVLVATIITLGLPTEQSAYAMVQASLQASQQAGNRRYEIRVVPPGEQQSEPRVIAELDIADRQHVVIRAAMRRGQRIVVGRNPNGPWAVRPDGAVVHFDGQRDRPRWIAFDRTSVLVESVDELLEQLRERYELEVTAAGAAQPPGGRPADHIVARRRDGGAHRPDRIELWIDPDSRLVQRMELRWEGQRRFDGRRDRRDAERESWRERRRDALRDRMGPTDDSADVDEEAAADRGAHVRPSARPGDRPVEGDDRPFRHRPRRGQFPQDGAAGGPPPSFVDGPPRFRDGRHPPPPCVIVFELMDTPEFPDDWFEPAAHMPID